MSCLFHKWTVWRKPYNAEEVVSRGDFGKTSTDDIVVQDRECIPCGKVEVRRLRGGKVDHD